MNYIDAHSHIWTPDTAHYPLAPGYFRQNMDPPSFTAEELQAHMKTAGVNRVVLIQMSFYGYDNRYMTDMMGKYKGMFSGVAVIDQDGQNPEPEMLRLKQLGVRGFRIYPKNLPPDRWLSSDGLRKMFALGTREKLAMCCLINPNALPALSKMCEEFPETPVVVDHLSRIGVGNNIQDSDVKLLTDLAKHKNTTVKLSAFYALGKAKPPYLDLEPMIRKVYDAYGPERLMWATDCPYQVVSQTYKQSIDLIESGLTFLSAADKEWILRKTAERVFFS
ncbi:MAG: amidohydrolase family protein [Planctomycetales bacterium]